MRGEPATPVLPFPAGFSQPAGAGMPPGPGLVQTTGPAPGVWLALVDIFGFVRRYLPGIAMDPGLGKPAVSLSAFSPRPEFLSPAEFAGVARFKVLKKQVEWICGRLAAKSAVASVCSFSPALDAIELAYRSQGAPYVAAGPALPVSISHSNAFAGAVASVDGHLGFDLERIRPQGIDAIMPVAFSETERRILAKADPETIFRHWTLKEAFLKQIGTGFNESLTAVEIIDGRLHHRGRPVANATIVQDTLPGGYVFSLIHSREPGQP